MYKFTEYYSDMTSISIIGALEEMCQKFGECVDMDIASSIVFLNNYGSVVEVINFHEDSSMDNSWWMDNLM